MNQFTKNLDVRINHARYVEVREKVIARLSLPSFGEGVIIPILGPTRCGKTDLICDLSEHAGTYSIGPGSIIESPDFCIGKIPPKPNDRDLYCAMLSATGFGFGDKENTRTVRDRLIKVVQDNAIRIIALDEVSHCAERGANLSERAAADHFKTIVDSTGVTLILVGLPRFQSIIDGNEQLRDRADGTIQFLPYNWDIEEDRDAFVSAVLSMFELLEKADVAFGFDDLDMARRLYGASGGRVGQVLRLLKRSTNYIVGHTLSLQSLKAAATEGIQQSAQVSPFFEETPPDDVALARTYLTIMSEAGLSVDPTSMAQFAARLTNP